MKNTRIFLSENFQFLEVKFSIYFNRRVFVMWLFQDGSSVVVLCMCVCGFICGVYFVIIFSSSHPHPHPHILFVPQEGCASWLWVSSLICFLIIGHYWKAKKLKKKKKKLHWINLNLNTSRGQLSNIFKSITCRHQLHQQCCTKFLLNQLLKLEFLKKTFPSLHLGTYIAAKGCQF